MSKPAETIRPALDTRLRLAGREPKLAPKPEPDMRITDPKKRAKALAKAERQVEHANAAATAKALREIAAPWFGCPAGRAIASAPALKSDLAGMDVPTLWDACQRVRAVYARYLAAIAAPSPYAAGMNLELMPEEFGSDGVEVDGGWDARTEDERVKDATRAMMHLDQVLGMAGEGVLAEVKAVVLRDEAVRHLDRLIVGLAAVARHA